jgi:hypothetical protein
MCIDQEMEITIIGMSIDDILLVSSSTKKRDRTIMELSNHFQISNLGKAKWLIGCCITQDRTK